LVSRREGNGGDASNGKQKLPGAWKMTAAKRSNSLKKAKGAPPGVRAKKNTNDSDRNRPRPKQGALRAKGTNGRGAVRDESTLPKDCTQKTQNTKQVVGQEKASGAKKVKRTDGGDRYDGGEGEGGCPRR